MIERGMSVEADWSGGRVIIDGEIRHLIMPDGPLYYGYYIFPFDTIEHRSEENGALFVLPPRTATRTVSLTNPEAVVTEIPLEGHGWLLMLGDDGRVKAAEFQPGDADRMVKVTLSAGKPAAHCWISADSMLYLFDSTCPPFDPATTERVVADGSPELPELFWLAQHALLNRLPLPAGIAVCTAADAGI
ncbi:hypothetical protein A2Z33_02175 [Candidatus Gottesmanbacteria bacterium RBG_16_52_11]|uniref:Uncharacterized protein n=1 Tax=Candidatus Gottesmanbacteria bacterium RBG_16_52_11 TaxID=1798374 RepID=A0A1F5YR70_9BACT|nr:MAG: hypothetical protein A2Z33_02175 [Candidatus Gottesmanbacteria bacterium RBG_16_52_11]